MKTGTGGRRNPVAFRIFKGIYPAGDIDLILVFDNF
jgi:hypothetical protein